MGELGLAMTPRVLEHVGRGAGDQKQIAVRRASAGIQSAPPVRSATQPAYDSVSRATISA